MNEFRTICVGLAVTALLFLGPEAARAQEGVGFRFLFGHQVMTGDLGPQFDPAVDADFSVMDVMKRVDNVDEPQFAGSVDEFFQLLLACVELAAGI